MADEQKLSPAFQKLSKPAQRALMGAGIYTAKDLANHTRAQVAKLHGMGPASFPVLEAALKEAGLKFK